MTKFTLTFKTPDVIDQLIINNEDLEEISKKLSKWIEYGEYVSIEFDLEKMTATVLGKGK